MRLGANDGGDLERHACPLDGLDDECADLLRFEEAAAPAVYKGINAPGR